MEENGMEVRFDSVSSFVGHEIFSYGVVCGNFHSDSLIFHWRQRLNRMLLPNYKRNKNGAYVIVKEEEIPIELLTRFPKEGYKQTPGHRAKISMAHKGRISWKKGLLGKTDQRVLQKKNRSDISIVV